jgi:hypothetical protein
MADSSRAIPEDLTYVVQGSDHPIFRIKTNNDNVFFCERCGNILIENYCSENFIGISILCAKCRNISTTPSIEPGDILPYKLIIIGGEKSGGYYFSDTAEISDDISLTTSKMLAQTQAVTAPRKAGAPPALDLPGLEMLVDTYNAITGNKFDVQLKILTKKSVSRSRFPFAWAVNKLRSQIRENYIDIDDFEINNALMVISMFHDCVSRWQHHPRFKSIGADLGKPYSFHHTSSAFIFAAFLHDNGNRIGLSLEDQYGSPNPDLYFKGFSGGRFYIEAKAPTKIQWNGNRIPEQFLRSSIQRHIRESRKQINEQSRGSLLLFSGYYQENISETLREIIEDSISVIGSSLRYLAGVSFMTVVLPEFHRDGKEVRLLPAGFSIETVINPHYDGEQPFRSIKP